MHSERPRSAIPMSANIDGRSTHLIVNPPPRVSPALDPLTGDVHVCPLRFTDPEPVRIVDGGSYLSHELRYRRKPFT